MLKKIMISTIIIIGSLIALLAIGVFAFVNLSPQFGQKPEGEDLERINKSENYKDSKFINLEKAELAGFFEVLPKLPELLSSKGKVPEKPFDVEFETNSNTELGKTYITWYGHSAFLLESDEKKILIDPMFGDVASPLPFGSSRFEYSTPIPTESFKDIDVVLISHDHYDHLDYPTIDKIKDEVKLFVVPLGIGSHLKSWGVSENRIVELDWWQSHKLDSYTFTATPARHFSGRGITDGNATQWAGWAIKNDSTNIFFSGDSGYGKHFSEIGEKLGPFDFAMVECGQYNESWKQIHMMPEESVAAASDLKAEIAMPIHWGAFKLALHTWTDPIIRFTQEAKKQNQNYLTPTIGSRYELGSAYQNSNWWERY
jgi:L-ascorbate metabolism protein UlaG (beta-lactamase superfamily)